MRFECEADVDRAMSTHGAADRLVGEDAVSVVLNVRNVVECAEQCAGIKNGDDAVRAVGAAVLNDFGLYGSDAAIFGDTGFELKNELLPNQDFYLHDVPFEQLNDNPVFESEFTLQNPDKSKASFYETSLKLKPQQLFKRIEEIKLKGEPTFSYKLFDSYPARADEDKMDISDLSAAGYKVYETSKARQHLAPARTVVDLHIEKLTDDWQRLSNFEMLTLQLKEFEKYYELAVAHRQPSIIFIHGLGTGRLRDEIHEQLRLKREVKSFVNQYHPSYGYGATEVFLQY